MPAGAVAPLSNHPRLKFVELSSCARPSPSAVLDAFLAARKLRRWLVQIRRDIVNSDDRVYDKLAPGIEERGRMLIRIRPAVLPSGHRGDDPVDDGVVRTGGAGSTDDASTSPTAAGGRRAGGGSSSSGGGSVAVPLSATAVADAVSVERDCLTFVTSHSLNMLKLAKLLEWERVRRDVVIFAALCVRNVLTVAA